MIFIEMSLYEKLVVVFAGDRCQEVEDGGNYKFAHSAVVTLTLTESHFSTFQIHKIIKK